ncbi:MAG: UbiD family decarboxylase [Thermoflexus sp.]|jgi:4-hydroxy-3-polyprenylbenzoate decarboxylase|nr:UbiD family decarboxylase [Thermoflexus sp.]
MLQEAERIPIAVALGGDPACIWAASAPLPPDIDEYLLAGSGASPLSW